MRCIAALFFCGLPFLFYSQQCQLDPPTQAAVIGFYNLENLYDTLDDPFKNDDDFTLKGINAWSPERYQHKIKQLARVVSEMGTEANPDGLALLGVCEVENIRVLDDLCATEQLAARKYKAILIEGPDARGVDPGLLYNPAYFKPRHSVSYHVALPGDTSHKTRDILVVSGNFAGEPLAVLVNHWPSRRGGELRSRASRNAAAKVARHIADSITRENAQTRVVIMGDLNDDPVNECVKKFIGTYDDVGSAVKGAYFNPMEKLYKAGIGTLAFKDSWNLFDQIMLNEPWLNGNTQTWQYCAVKVNNKPYLKGDHGNFKGYPFRTYSGGTYTGGYSDHFASYIIVVRTTMKR